MKLKGKAEQDNPHYISTVVQYIGRWNTQVQWHNSGQSTSVRLACYTVCSFVGLTAATQFSASEFLQKYETEFFEVVDPRLSLLTLVRKGVITEDVKPDINTSNTADTHEVLYHHLTHHANVYTLNQPPCRVQ